MNRKIMDGLSYGFYFIIICILLLVVYLFFFKSDRPKKSSTTEEDNNPQIVSENIKLNKTDLSLDIGESFDLKVTLIPSNGKEVIRYESSDENVAVVDENGKIKGISAGTATILVTVDDTNLKAECKIEVSGNTIIAQDLFVQSERVNLKPGETYQLNVTVIPSDTVDKSLSYSSSNEQFLTVDENGLITALSKGRAMVTVQSNSNPNVKITIDVVVG